MIHATNKRAAVERLWRNKNVYHYYYPLPPPCNASILYSVRNNNNNGIQLVTFPGRANEINTSIADGHDRPNYHTLPPVCDTSLRPCVTYRYLYNNNNNGCTSSSGTPLACAHGMQKQCENFIFCCCSYGRERKRERALFPHDRVNRATRHTTGTTTRFWTKEKIRETKRRVQQYLYTEGYCSIIRIRLTTVYSSPKTLCAPLCRCFRPSTKYNRCRRLVLRRRNVHHVCRVQPVERQTRAQNTGFEPRIGWFDNNSLGYSSRGFFIFFHHMQYITFQV